jgi:hypothetical protein
MVVVRSRCEWEDDILPVQSELQPEKLLVYEEIILFFGTVGYSSFLARIQNSYSIMRQVNSSM